MKHRKKLAAFMDSAPVQNFITGLILINAITLGLETSQTIMQSAGAFLAMFDKFVILVFAAEIILKLYANGLKFFKSGWNLFDFGIVGMSLVASSGLSVLRALRILRVLRLLKIMPRLKFIIDSLFRSLPDLLWIFALILVFFYIYGVMGTKLFASEFPELFGNFGTTMLTLFQLMTLENWYDGITKHVTEKYPVALLYFISFILITSIVVLNLIIAVIVSGIEAMEESRTTRIVDELEEDFESDKQEILRELDSVKEKLERIESKLGRRSGM